MKDSDRMFAELGGLCSPQPRGRAPDDEVMQAFGVLGDALEEENNPLHLTVRWMVKNTKRPSCPYTPPLYIWYRCDSDDAELDPASDLPSFIWKELETKTPGRIASVRYDSLREAVEDLHHSLSKKGLIRVRH